jgi:hypothetical protein
MNTRRAAVISVALCGSLAFALPSYAGIVTRIPVSPQQIDTGQWGAAPSTTMLPFGTQGVQSLYFTVTNTGTLPLTGATYTLSGSNFKVGMTLSLLACVGGTWDMTTNVCTGGTVQTVVTTTGPTASAAVTLPAAPGASTTLQAELSKNPARTTVGSLMVTVDRSQVRASTVVNS